MANEDHRFLTPDALLKYHEINAAATEAAAQAAMDFAYGLHVKDEKEYSDIYASSNTEAYRRWYFANIKPNNYYAPSRARFKIDLWVPENSANKSTYFNYLYSGVLEVCITRNDIVTYANWNMRNTTYAPVYYSVLARAAGLSNAETHGHLYGIDLVNCTNLANANYKRSVRVQLLEYDNCEVTLWDEAKQIANISNWSTSIWTAVTSMNMIDNGLQEYGDANTIDRIYAAALAPKAAVNRNKNGEVKSLYNALLVFSNDQGQSFFSICTNTRRVYSSASTANLPTTLGFEPELIWYYSGGVTASGNSGSTYSMYKSLPFDWRYSSNYYTEAYGSLLVTGKPVYLICDYNEDDRLFYLNTDNTLANIPVGTIAHDQTNHVNYWSTLTLPTTEDGKYYIYLGMAYSTASIWLEGIHHIYTYKDGSFVLFDPRKKGDKGEQGKLGVGVKAVSLVGLYSSASGGINKYNIYSTDSPSNVLGTITVTNGERGADSTVPGPQGVGVGSVVFKSTNDRTRTYSVKDNTSSENELGTFTVTDGHDGDNGKAATIKIGTVTSGDTASVTNSGTSNAAVLNFVLPKGEKGTLLENEIVLDPDTMGVISGETTDLHKYINTITFLDTGLSAVGYGASDEKIYFNVPGMEHLQCSLLFKSGSSTAKICLEKCIASVNSDIGEPLFYLTGANALMAAFFGLWLKPSIVNNYTLMYLDTYNGSLTSHVNYYVEDNTSSYAFTFSIGTILIYTIYTDTNFNIISKSIDNLSLSIYEFLDNDFGF